MIIISLLIFEFSSTQCMFTDHLQCHVSILSASSCCSLVHWADSLTQRETTTAQQEVPDSPTRKRPLFSVPDNGIVCWFRVALRSWWLKMTVTNMIEEAGQVLRCSWPIWNVEKWDHEHGAEHIAECVGRANDLSLSLQPSPPRHLPPSRLRSSNPLSVQPSRALSCFTFSWKSPLYRPSTSRP